MASFAVIESWNDEACAILPFHAPRVIVPRTMKPVTDYRTGRRGNSFTVSRAPYT